MSTPPEPPAKARPAWGLPVGLIAAGAVLVGGAVTLALTLGGPATFALTGTLSIDNASADGPLPDGFACAGTGPMADITPNLHVIVSDGDHVLLGKGQLTSSFSAGPGTCVFGLVVNDLPSDRPEYLVQISHRGESSFTQTEAAAGIVLTLKS